MINEEILPLETFNKNINKLEKSVRSIVINSKTYGTGFLMELKKEKAPFYCLITMGHIIS